MHAGGASRWWSFAKIPYALMAVATLWCGWLNLRNALAIVRQVHPVEYGEGPILFHALRLTEHLPLYLPPGQWPSIFAPYGPVGYGLVALCVHFFGVSFAAPRMMVVASAAGVAILVALLLRHLTRSWILALAFGPMFLCLMPTQTWMALLRFDLVGLFFSLAGFVVFAINRKLWPLAAVLMVLAIFCKVTLLSAPAACVLWLLVRREWRPAAKFAGLGLGLIAVGFALSQFGMGGAFFFHMFKTHPDEFTWAHYHEIMRPMLAKEAYLPLLALPCLLLLKSRDSMLLAALYVCVSTASTITAGDSGSADNHLLEWSAVLCLAGGLAAHQLLQSKSWRYAGLALALVLPIVCSRYAVDWAQSAYKDSSGCGATAAYLRSRGEMVFSEDVGDLVLTGKRVYLSDPFIEAQLAMRRNWPEPYLLQALRSGSVDAVLTSCELDHCAKLERWSPAVTNEILRNFRLARAFRCPDAYFAYEPVRGEQPSGPAATP